jgi:hypothetical protein
MPSFRRFPSANVPGDVPPVKGWWSGGVSREPGTDYGSLARPSECGTRGLESEGMTGCA